MVALFLKFALSVVESSTSELPLCRLLWTGDCCGPRVGEAIERKIGIPSPPAIEPRQSNSQGDNHRHLTTSRSQ